MMRKTFRAKRLTIRVLEMKTFLWYCIVMFLVPASDRNGSFSFYNAAVHGFSSAPKREPLSACILEQFVFAKNDVCVKPAVFVCDTSTMEEDGEGEVASKKFRMRNVPGEGDCMFQAVALCTSTSMGLGGNASLLRSVASETRHVVAQILSNPKGTLHVQGKRLIRARDLLESAAKEEGITPSEYIQQILDHKLQGGGPELTVLSNVLRRPISIYEIDENNPYDMGDDTCHIKCVGCFGDYFQDPCSTIPNSAVLSKGLQPGAYSWHIHILVVDSGNGEKHACALLPEIPNFQ